MKIRGILFDLDETLHAREKAFWAWIREEAVGTSLDLDRVALLDARGRGSKPALLEYLARGLCWPEVSLEARLQRLRAGVLRHTTVNVRLKDMLARLQSSFALGIVSNGTSASQRGKIAALELDAYFDPILISEEVGLRKPQPEIFWIASNRWNIPPNEVLVVGDDWAADIEGARAAGMHAVRVAGESGAGTDELGSVIELEAWLGLRGSYDVAAATAGVTGRGPAPPTPGTGPD